MAPVLFALALWGPPVAGAAQPAEPDEPQSPSYQLSGSVGWLVRYGLGDGRGLSRKDFSKGLFFSQSVQLDADLSVPVQKPVPGLLTLLAQLNNEQPAFLQSVKLNFEGDPWRASYGELPMGRSDSPFVSSSRTLKGAKVEWDPTERLTVSGVLSQVSGVKQTKTFRGNTAEESITYAFHRPQRPLLEMPYLQNLEGLEHFPLGASFVEGFTEVELAFQTDSKLNQVLSPYGLGYLADPIDHDPERELPSSAYDVILADGTYSLVLRSEFDSLLRDRIRTYIDDYNREQGLSGNERKSYPLSEGTDYERAFLAELGELVSIRVGSQSFRADQALRRRFYALGRRQVLRESVSLEVKREAGGEFLSIRDPSLVNFSFDVHPDAGIVELDFPPEFFEERDAEVRVTYAYQSESGTYSLGLSVLRGSEKVYLNGQQLQRGEDYIIRYEVGLLVLTRDVGPDDVLRIEYEVARSGIFGATEYRRNFQRISALYRPYDNFKLDVDLLRADDALQPGTDPRSVALMPNTHTVVGVSGELEGDSYRTAFDFGFNVNRFPTDDNQKAHLPNRTNAIGVVEHGGQALALFGHRNGLLVYDGHRWSSFGVAQGLAGRTVNDMAAKPGKLILATSSGLSILSLGPGDPLASFGQRSNWTTVGQMEGLPTSQANAVLMDGDTVWVGTNRGLARAPLENVTDPQEWTVYREEDDAGLVSERVLHLALASGASQKTLYLGTDQGLMIFDRDQGSFRTVGGVRVPVNDLAVDGSTVYAATRLGVRAIKDGRGLGWPVSGLSVNAVAVGDGSLWYGSDNGLYERTSGLVSRTEGRVITALEIMPGGGAWAGESATENYDMRLYEASLGKVNVYPPAETRLDGRAKDRYVGIPAQEHTDVGWIGQVALTRELGPIQLTGTLESVSPEFSPMGALNRRDHLSLGLGATYPLSSSVSLRARHEEGLLDLFRSTRQSVRDAVGLSFGAGPQLDLDYSIERVNRDFGRSGFERINHSYALSASEDLIGDRLSLGLSYDLIRHQDLSRPRQSSLEGQAGGEASFQVLPGLKLRLGYTRPLNRRFGQSWGNRKLEWGANWSTAISLGSLPISIKAVANGNRQQPVDGGKTVLDQQAQMTARLPSLRMGSAVLSPRGSFSVRLGDLLGINSSTQVTGEGTLQARWRDWEGRAQYQRGGTHHGYSDLTQVQHSLNTSVSYTGAEGVRPTLEFSGSLNTFRHPLFGHRSNAQYRVGLQVNWQALGPFQADLSLERQAVQKERERTISYALSHSLKYLALEAVTPRLVVSSEFLQGERRDESVEELSGEIKLEATFTPIPDWSATFSTTYLLGLNAVHPQRSYNSFALSLNFGRDFSFF